MSSDQLEPAPTGKFDQNRASLSEWVALFVGLSLIVVQLLLDPFGLGRLTTPLVREIMQAFYVTSVDQIFGPRKKEDLFAIDKDLSSPKPIVVYFSDEDLAPYRSNTGMPKHAPADLVIAALESLAILQPAIIVLAISVDEWMFSDQFELQDMIDHYSLASGPGSPITFIVAEEMAVPSTLISASPVVPQAGNLHILLAMSSATKAYQCQNDEATEYRIAIRSRFPLPDTSLMASLPAKLNCQDEGQMRLTLATSALRAWSCGLSASEAEPRSSHSLCASLSTMVAAAPMTLVWNTNVEPSNIGRLKGCFKPTSLEQWRLAFDGKPMLPERCTFLPQIPYANLKIPDQRDERPATNHRNLIRGNVVFVGEVVSGIGAPVAPRISSSLTDVFSHAVAYSNLETYRDRYKRNNIVLFGVSMMDSIILVVFLVVSFFVSRIAGISSHPGYIAIASGAFWLILVCLISVAGFELLDQAMPNALSWWATSLLFIPATRIWR